MPQMASNVKTHLRTDIPNTPIMQAIPGMQYASNALTAAKLPNPTFKNFSDSVIYDPKAKKILPMSPMHQMTSLDNAQDVGYLVALQAMGQLKSVGNLPKRALARKFATGVVEDASVAKQSLLSEAKGIDPKSATLQQQKDILKNMRVGKGEYKVGEVYTQKIMGNDRPIVVTKVNPDGSVEGYYTGAMSPTEKSFGIDQTSLQPAKWNNPTKELQIPKETIQGVESNPLLSKARKYKSAEEFVKAQPTIYRGGTTDGKYFSTSKTVANDFAKNRGGSVSEYVLKPDAKVASYSDFPDARYKGINDYNVNIFSQGKDLKTFQDNLLESDYIKAENWAKQNGYDALKLPTEGEIRVINSGAVKTKSQLTDIWKQATKRVEPTTGGQPIPEKPQLSKVVDPVLEVKGKTLEEVLQTPEKQIQPIKQPVLKIKTPVQEAQVLKIKKEKTKEASLGNLQSLDDIVGSSELNVKDKVNALDYLRTPDRVLQKLGLGKQADKLKAKYNDYLDQVPKEIEKITQWYKRVGGSEEASQRIFKYLDGQSIKLEGEELKVAGEIQVYLKDWADKLNLPQDRRIASYITHIFEKDFIQKEFDPEIAKLIQDRVPGSVYDPFLESRLGKQGYVEDAFRALDAYVKRATRKYNMDEALEGLSRKAENLDVDSWNYVKKYADRINMRPDDVDNLIDNMVKSSPIGYKLGQRPVAMTTRKLRQSIYRGTLGLNIGSAIRNLTQGVNTYAQLGEKYTAIGYYKMVKSLISGGKELSETGVLRSNMIEDRTISAVKKFWEQADKGLFSFFELAEKVNRGGAYFGAKARAIAGGKTEKEAIQEGIEMARKTQFTFGSVDTPVALQSDIAKVLTQFQSFNIKQVEFLAEMVKGKEYAGLTRWIGANMLLLFTVGKVMGWDWKDFIPFGNVLEGQNPIGGSPAFSLGRDVLALASGGKDRYGNEMTPLTAATNLIPFVPGGVQILNKTLPGLYDVNRGYATSGYGAEKLYDMAVGNDRRIKYPIQQTPRNFIQAGILGGSNLPEAREYKEKSRSVLGDIQSKVVRESDDRLSAYQKIIQKRESDKDIAVLKEKAKETNKIQNEGSVYLIPQPDGSIKTIDMSFQPSYPALTGQTELDKKLMSQYKGDITRKSNDIRVLYEAGKLTAEEAEKELNKLIEIKNKVSTTRAKKAPKITIKKLSAPKVARIKLGKFKVPKIPKRKPLKIKKYTVKLSK
jgi:hypothetical protein